ncbi:L-glutamate gamma-semialdehyde dehydrogenase, partial [archaeon]|nr:L-glutamate gamma-semialdehyde dehydrogenase [archaeon]NDF28233.1 L-glutamate gamma-semialdehyde dehydrogenase [archaeon]
SYLKGSPELKLLNKELERQKSLIVDIPLIIGGKRIYTKQKGELYVPHDKSHQIATFSKAEKEHLELAVKAAKEAKVEWETMNWQDRMSIFLKAADLLSGPYRYILNAATMLGQSKNILQAEIDSACELIDFWRFNPYYAQQIYSIQPDSSPEIWNRSEYRSLEGFVLAIAPFNFTSIAGNLPTAPAMMGNTVLFKPASTSVLSSYYIMEILEKAGLPPGVINFIPGKGSLIGEHLLPHPDLAGIHFTGSTNVFQNMWETVGKNIATYRSYPRIVGETGGKDFVFVHSSADVDEVVTALIRGSFEYAGQKCSAASRAYIPNSLWPSIKEQLLQELSKVKTGDPTNIDTTVNAVIDQSAFNSISQYISYAEESSDAKVLTKINIDDSVGYFIHPTVVETSNPKFKLLEEEIFGPVLTIFTYEDSKFEETLTICDNTSPYALTGSIFAKERTAINTAFEFLRHSAGNFYINDKPTGAVVNQQPFGGGRASGTNDKAGSQWNLMRWTSPRSIKENFNPPTNFDYPYMR